jgi:hypothetical protein
VRTGESDHGISGGAACLFVGFDSRTAHLTVNKQREETKVRNDVVATMVAKIQFMADNGCGTARELAEGKVQWHLSTRSITAVEAAAILRSFPA